MKKPLHFEPTDYQHMAVVNISPDLSGRRVKISTLWTVPPQIADLLAGELEIIASRLRQEASQARTTHKAQAALKSRKRKGIKS